MKRAKIMLLAIMVVAVVGGALAFKAQRFAHKNIYCATSDNQGIIYCTSTIFKSKTPIAPSVSTPCITWHNALGLGVTRTSSCYTTTAETINGVVIPCFNPIRCICTDTVND